MFKNVLWRKGKFFLMFIVAFLFFPRQSQAVVPPDFIFNIGSQIAQAFSVVVVFLSAIFVTAYQFLKVKFVTLKVNKAFWIISITTIIIGSFAFAVFYTAHEQKVNYNKWLGWFQQAGQKSSSENKNYFYDRLIVSGKDTDGEQFAMVFEGSRQELKEHLYGHTYSVSILYKNKVYKDFSVFNGALPSIQANQFVKNFSSTITPEVSNETYHFVFDLKDKIFTFDIKNLASDFLVKNTLEYLRYVSSGTVEINVGGVSSTLPIMVDKVLSDNGSVPTLQGYDPRYTSHSLVVWDERGRFYHIDISKVLSENIPYASHTWVLYKNPSGITQKSFNAQLDFTGGKVPQWKINLPDIENSSIQVQGSKFIKEGINEFSTVIEGVLRDKEGGHKVTGFAFYENKQ